MWRINSLAATPPLGLDCSVPKKLLNIDANPTNADWPKRVKDKISDLQEEANTEGPSTPPSPPTQLELPKDEE